MTRIAVVAVLALLARPAHAGCKDVSITIKNHTGSKVIIRGWRVDAGSHAFVERPNNPAPVADRSTTGYPVAAIPWAISMPVVVTLQWAWWSNRRHAWIDAQQRSEQACTNSARWTLTVGRTP